MKDIIYTEDFTEEYKAKVLELVKLASSGNAVNLSSADFVILMHWKHHEDDPAYSFVPEEYRGYR